MMNTEAYTLHILEYNNSAIEGEKEYDLSEYSSCQWTKREDQSQPINPIFFCFIELISKGPVTIVTPGGLLITKFVKTL